MALHGVASFEASVALNARVVHSFRSCGHGDSMPGGSMGRLREREKMHHLQHRIKHASISL
eukprot:6496997-Lingulodinium_polyedra.AAC.1